MRLFGSGMQGNVLRMYKGYVRIILEVHCGSRFNLGKVRVLGTIRWSDFYSYFVLRKVRTVKK
jgi:hypothetical protein